MHPPLALHAERLTKRYGRRTALADCDLSVPRGHVVGLVGPNGAGKSTLLQLACGLIAPTSGSLTVLGSPPAADAAHLARVGFVAQDTPVYASLTVAEHLRMGAWLNPSWDAALARRRVAEVGLDPAQKAGRLSGGQRAQLALALAAAKRPELLILDEPAAALDPLARREFMHGLAGFVRELGSGAVLSSHLLGDVAQVCDHLVVLCAARVQVAGPVTDLLATHRRAAAAPAGAEVVWAEPGRVVVRGPAVRDDAPVTLEELVLAYLSRAAARTAVIR
ncbi:ABC transporter ATP-binding protein [Micromonospora sp. AMSO1212t]|uniref:ABC transporter ATP-binding protein n=1 Tax=Micromonospora sp. AMSO1212t TaxID=2650565 RepID=UPI00124B2A66|nr:ABC transporter ATP-binding protein [Micromonospora sp. AMSO1212t]KAB1908407.1 ABC transporter ATP-binding protein [Micromonospora sp. AMSO1212t]